METDRSDSTGPLITATRTTRYASTTATNVQDRRNACTARLKPGPSPKMYSYNHMTAGSVAADSLDNSDRAQNETETIFHFVASCSRLFRYARKLVRKKML